MATFDKSKVICGANAEQAEIGKRYWFSDDIGSLKSRMLHDIYGSHILKHVNAIEYGKSPFVDDYGHEWEFIYPCEESPKQTWLKEYLDVNCDSKIEAHNSKIDIENVCKKILEEVKCKITEKQELGFTFSNIDSEELKEIIEELGINV